MTVNAKPIILWNNLLAGSGVSLSATSSADDHPVEHLADWREYLTWKATSGEAQEIIADLGTAQTATSLCIYGHNLKTAGVTSVVLYGSNGSGWTQIISHTVTSDLPILKIFSSAQYKYFKLAISAGTSAPEIALLFIGPYLQFPSWLPAGFDPNHAQVITEETRSEDGYLLGAVTKYKKRRLTLNFSILYDSWVQNDFIPFWDTHIPKPFIFAWDYTNHPTETYLMTVAEPRRELPFGPVYRSLKLELEGRI